MAVFDHRHGKRIGRWSSRLAMAHLRGRITHHSPATDIHCQGAWPVPSRGRPAWHDRSSQHAALVRYGPSPLTTRDSGPKTHHGAYGIDPGCAGATHAVL